MDNDRYILICYLLLLLTFIFSIITLCVIGFMVFFGVSIEIICKYAIITTVIKL